jgi:hypothetical protein
MTPNRCGVLFVRKYRLALFYLYSIKRELKVAKKTINTLRHQNLIFES